MIAKNDRRRGFERGLSQLSRAFDARFISRNGGLFVLLKYARESRLLEPGPSGGAENTFNHFHVDLRFTGTRLERFRKNRQVAEALAAVWREMAWRAHPEHEPVVCVTNEIEEWVDGTLEVHSIVRLWSGNGSDANGLREVYHIDVAGPEDVLVCEEEWGPTSLVDLRSIIDDAD